jgi:transmembrane sensor
MDDQACHWIVRLSADTVSEQDHQAFALWLAASPAHRDSMDTMLDLWEDLEVLKYRPGEERAQPSRRRWLGTGIALAASLLVAMLLSPGLGFGPDSQHYRTQLGEQLAVDLSDGSSVWLNTNTAIDVIYNAEERRITLQRGEAFFQVAHDNGRPFLVQAGHTEVKALGTAFNILLKGERSEVTVTEGVVRITELDAPATRPAQVQIVHENQRISGSREGLEALPGIEANNLLAWREGKLVAHGMPLAALVEELSRYHPTEIFIAEPGLSDTTVSGVFRLDDLDGILLALEHTVGVRSVVLDDGSIQLIKAPL